MATIPNGKQSSPCRTVYSMNWVLELYLSYNLQWEKFHKIKFFFLSSDILWAFKSYIYAISREYGTFRPP